ncbi:GspH/FimT family pseudopilin [Nevskia sp.]|uniref:GspH/FimT family pseudopilin n=1 Tax=Nevskia sp. TaxID=1929292 RepID=UPI0025F8FA23|nr:GspH/FimT family pseudopilin [Nevskia sp.]
MPRTESRTKRRIARRSARGFSLPEMMTTLAIVAITGTLAAPAVGDLMLGNRMATEANTLISALNFARSEAVGAARVVSLCPYRVVVGATDVNARYQCADSLNWSGGWMVVRATVDEAGTASGGQQVLKLFGSLDPGDALTGSANRISYLPTGFLADASEPSFRLRPSACTEDQQRNITLSLQGHPYVAISPCTA